MNEGSRSEKTEERIKDPCALRHWLNIRADWGKACTKSTAGNLFDDLRNALASMAEGYQTLISHQWIRV